MSYEYRKLVGKLSSDPFVYFKSKENKLILGSNNYKKKIDGFVTSGFIDAIRIGNNRYNKDIYGYVPKIEPATKVFKYNKYIEKYYQYLLTDLSFFGKMVVSNLNHIKIDLIDEYYYMVVDKFLYPNYLNRKNKTDIVSYDEYRKRFEWVYKHIKNFNESNYDEMINFVKEDIYGHRIHSIVTMLSKEFRKRILIDDEESVEIDLEQSQPNICSVIIKESIGDNSFSKVVEHSNVYKYIQDNLGLSSLGEAKEFYFRSAYGRPASSDSLKLYHMFPDIEAYIRYIKSTPLITNPNYKYYTNYAHIAQRKESEIFREVWRELYKYNIIFVPVHDSIIVKARQSDIAISIMYSILKDKIHNNIKLKKRSA
jgi:hypothetical protein